jgi:hypothetical protein
VYGLQQSKGGEMLGKCAKYGTGFEMQGLHHTH